MPFKNLNPGEQQDYFSDGIQQEISSDLGRIATLKVISLGETRDDPGTPRDYPALGRELGVDFLLEGDVRRQNGRASIELRLIDVHAPASPWRVQDEQPLSKVFAAEAGLVRRVAGRLGASLTDEEEEDIDKPLTTSAEAHDLYLESFAGPQAVGGPKEARGPAPGSCPAGAGRGSGPEIFVGLLHDRLLARQFLHVPTRFHRGGVGGGPSHVVRSGIAIRQAVGPGLCGTSCHLRKAFSHDQP